MATLKGQNFRILIYDSTASKYKVVGMSTNCVVTLNTNVDDGGTKDDVGLAAKPVVVSKSWQVQVESLDVSDAGAMLTALKSLTPFTLIWDEVSTTDNQSPVADTGFARTGQAYLSDATFTFNDRENSSKNLQFSGCGAIDTLDATPTIQAISAGSYTKGQFVRLFLNTNNASAPTSVIAAAKQLSLHVSLPLEDATTKDTDGDWIVQEPTALNYDISTTALMRSNDTIISAVGSLYLATIEEIYESVSPVKWQIANVSGDNNRTKGSVIASGSVIIQTLTLNGPNRQNATYTAQLQGYGAYTVGA